MTPLKIKSPISKATTTTHQSGGGKFGIHVALSIMAIVWIWNMSISRPIEQLGDVSTTSNGGGGALIFSTSLYMNGTDTVDSSTTTPSSSWEKNSTNVQGALDSTRSSNLGNAMVQVEGSSSSSRTMQCRPKLPNIKTCICHKALFGTIDLDLVQSWMDYYRAIGIDHFFFWKWGDIIHTESFQAFETAVSSYATIQELPDSFVRKKPFEIGQLETERRCMKLAVEQGYDWALFVDTDEFLWFQKEQSLKEFLQEHETNTYISLGKWMYSVRNSVVKVDDDNNNAHENIGGWGISSHPFTPGPYCYKKPHLAKNCPTWLGRCKVILRPEQNSIPNIHGDGKRGANWTHIDTDLAHMKEWPGLGNRNYSHVPRPREDFTTRELDTHWFTQSHPKNQDGTTTVHYDSQLESWLRFVESQKQCPDVKV